MKQNLVLLTNWLLVIALLLMPLQGVMAAPTMPDHAMSEGMAMSHIGHEVGEQVKPECHHCDDNPLIEGHGSHNCHEEGGSCLSMGHCMFGLVSFTNLAGADFSVPTYQHYRVPLHTIDLTAEIKPPRA